MRSPFVSLETVRAAPWFRLPLPFQWGFPVFGAATTIGMLAGYIASMVESVGDYYAWSRLAAAQNGQFDPYEMVPLGKTGLKVSRVGIGTGMRGWQRKSNQTRLGKQKLEALLRGCYERGVRLFDMADLQRQTGSLCLPHEVHGLGVCAR